MRSFLSPPGPRCCDKWRVGGDLATQHANWEELNQGLWTFEELQLQTWVTCLIDDLKNRGGDMKNVTNPMPVVSRGLTQISLCSSGRACLGPVSKIQSGPQGFLLCSFRERQGSFFFYINWKCSGQNPPVSLCTWLQQMDATLQLPFLPFSEGFRSSFLIPGRTGMSIQTHAGQRGLQI